MRRLGRIVLLTTVALVAAVVLYAGVTLPPSSLELSEAPSNTIFGAFHIHTSRSDGSGTLSEVAKAAGAAGLRFVVVTDHGDGTRAPEPPHYQHGVLVLDAVEINTNAGHLIAMGLEAAAPYPLGAEARDTIEDVHRMGGWVVAAHPDSPHERLRWRDGSLIDGLEWLNADSEWRDEPARRLAMTLARYFIRPPESIASIFQRPVASLRRWDAASRSRRIVGLAAVDAHARIGPDEDPDEGGSAQASRAIFARPTYEDMFRTLVQGIDLTEPLSGDPVRDAPVVLDALRRGRTFSVVRALAFPGVVKFSASDAGRTAGIGESLDAPGPVTLSAIVPAPPEAAVVILRDGEEVAGGAGSVTHAVPGLSGSYRVEVRLPGADVPWIVTNMIRLGHEPAEAAALPQTATPIRPLANAVIWAVEKHAGSDNATRVEDGGVAMTFALAGGRPSGQYAAVAYPMPGGEAFESVSLSLRASVPMRVSVQLRQPGGADGVRWHRSVYVDENLREVVLPLKDFTGPSGEVLDSRQVTSVLLVVDSTHTKPGTSGTVWMSNVSIGGPAAPATSSR